ncbi:MAG: hypothetical protein VBE63_10955 [Lamprobacter sp.]|uniref:hypothetical protein n=1 Tax=Lamprobacter sp. TaxID=3100796 RepID=UPI002B25865F|nr:hypothetical protein [Lamprobacter sp.]MEA3640450.1 hypothetical protein [Lamprobacter sp.]
MALSRLAILAIVSGISLVLSGCFYTNAAQVPMAKTYPYSEQQRMQAAHHWQVLAEYEAKGILQQPNLRAIPLYLPEQTDHTSGEFARGYRSLLTSELVSGGAIIKHRPGHAATLNFNVEVINHSDRGFIRPYPGAMTLAAFASGVSVLVAPSSNAALALIPPVVGADVTSGSWSSVSDEEVIITTKITDNERVLYSSSNIYYINQGDRRHYAPHRVPKPPPVTRVPLDNQW